MFFNYLFNNLTYFQYEINFISNLWFSHFIDFCLLLNFKDYFFILLILYIFFICLGNLSLVIKRFDFVTIIISPLKLLFDFTITYLISKFLIINFYYFLFIFLKDVNEILFFSLFLISIIFFLIFVIGVPIYYLKLSNKIIFNKLINKI